jgi:DNA-binding response OmpR family regulator
VARVLICEPHDDIAALLELVVRRLGHEPVTSRGGELDQIGIDAAVIEPGEPDGLRLAERLARHGIPVLFTSIFPADHAMLALHPAAYLVKPFPLYALERALDAALTRDPAAAAPLIATGGRKAAGLGFEPR